MSAVLILVFTVTKSLCVCVCVLLFLLCEALCVALCLCEKFDWLIDYCFGFVVNLSFDLFVWKFQIKEKSDQMWLSMVQNGYFKSPHTVKEDFDIAHL